MTKENKETIAWVYAKNKWVDSDIVEFLNISEDIFGRDQMNFKYKGKEWSSIIIVSSNKPD